jgi:hypothetical protein
MSDRTRTPGELENRVAETRSRIDATLTAIEARLTTGQIAEQTLDYLRQSGAREFAANLAGSVKHNPLPVSLLAIGLAWLMAAERSGHGSGTCVGTAESLDHVRDELGDKVADVKERAAAARQKIADAGHAAREGAERIREGAHRVGDRAREQWDAARGTYKILMREQPLALGAIGFGIGAALAAFLPRTHTEDELMGRASDHVKDEATAVAKAQAEPFKRAGSASAHAAGDELGSETSVIHNEPARDLGRMQGSRPGASPAVRSAEETPSVADSPHGTGATRTTSKEHA